MIIEGIHCAACVWLNEKFYMIQKVLLKQILILQQIKQELVWDNEKLKLSEIILKKSDQLVIMLMLMIQLADLQASKAKRDYFIRMMVAVIASMNIMMLSVAKYTGFFLQEFQMK